MSGFEKSVPRCTKWIHSPNSAFRVIFSEFLSHFHHTIRIQYDKFSARTILGCSWTHFGGYSLTRDCRPQTSITT